MKELINCHNSLSLLCRFIVRHFRTAVYYVYICTAVSCVTVGSSSIRFKTR